MKHIQLANPLISLIWKKMSVKIHFSEIVYNFDKREQKKWIHTKNKLQNTEIADSRM